MLLRHLPGEVFNKVAEPGKYFTNEDRSCESTATVGFALADHAARIVPMVISTVKPFIR